MADDLSTIDLESYWRRRESISTDSGVFIDSFRPVIPWQRTVLEDIRLNYDYSNGLHEILLSGSVGSAKSIFLAHLSITHCMLYSGACVGVFRLSFPDLRDTIFKEITDHLECDSLIDGKDYWINQTRCQISFRNGSRIVCKSFHDKKYTKVRSMKLSMAIFEEFTEFALHKQAYNEVRNRLGRIPNIKENILIAATNPDAPSIWIYEKFIANEAKDKNIHTYYSLTFDNPFLPTSYIKAIMRGLDSKQVLRMIFGRWIELKTDIIYYEYSELNNREDYVVDKDKPIHICWDFNIGNGKPLSCCFFQVNDLGAMGYEFHVFGEVVVEGMRTIDSLEEITDKGILDNYGNNFFVHGDAAGSHNDTRSKRTDYDIIMKYLQNYTRKEKEEIKEEIDQEIDQETDEDYDSNKLNVIKAVPPSNPPIRTRHNKVNGLLKNALGEIRLYIYDKAITVRKGLRLTKLKDNGSLIEDDGAQCPYQHVTTALGYGVIAAERYYDNQKRLREAARRAESYG